FGSLKTFKTGGQGGGFGPRNLNAYRVLRVPADAREFGADVTVDPGVSRVVKIVGPDGRPVSGAWVLNTRPYGGTEKPLTGSEVTATALDPERPRRLYAQHDGKRLGGYLSLDGKEDGPAVLRLAPTATVTGQVVDRDGNPVAGARVSPSYDDEEIGISLNTIDHYSTTPLLTDAEGRFTLVNVAPRLPAPGRPPRQPGPAAP